MHGKIRGKSCTMLCFLSLKRKRIYKYHFAMKYYLYCDESCHLLRDKIKCMVLGCCWAPKDMIPVINSNIKDIKVRNGISANGELKWTKISPNNSKVYRELINYFFENDVIKFRGILIPDKSVLHHADFGQSHDEWYYKMMYQLVMPIMTEDNEYCVFLDYKDIYGGERSHELKKVLEHKHLPWGSPKVDYIQCLPSNENPMIQLADILAGAISYNKRGLQTNRGKQEIINIIKRKSYCRLDISTPLSAEKFNLFIWRGRESR